MKRKIGILGGTFDPIHKGHTNLANSALHTLGLDEVVLVPSGCSYMKNHVSNKEHRYHMTCLAAENYPRVSVSTIDLEKDGNSYTCDTLPILQQKLNASLYYIIGADTVFMLEKWKRPDIVMACATLVVSVREGYCLQELETKVQELKTRFQAQIELLPVQYFPYSSTEIRQRISQHDDIREMLDTNVLAYIQKHKLYC